VTWRFVSLCGGVEVAFYRTRDGHVKKVVGIGECERERVSIVALAYTTRWERVGPDLALALWPQGQIAGSWADPNLQNPLASLTQRVLWVDPKNIITVCNHILK